LENLTNLTEFWALNTAACVTNSDCNAISDIGPLASLTNLQSLYLGNNNISDITPLIALTNLQDLFLNNIENNNMPQNAVTDISVLPNLLSLTRLNINRNPISNLSVLSQLAQLQFLAIVQTGMTDFTLINNLAQAQELYLGNVSDACSPLCNTMTDVGWLSGFSNLNRLNLRFLNIGGAGVGRVDTLQSLTNASAIYLQGSVTMSCQELNILITQLGSPPVNTDGDLATSDTATDGVNCTAP
jgi:internalin A